MTQQPRQPGTDLISDLQRWLVRSGARGVSRELRAAISIFMNPRGSDMVLVRTPAAIGMLSRR